MIAIGGAIALLFALLALRAEREAAQTHRMRMARLRRRCDWAA